MRPGIDAPPEPTKRVSLSSYRHLTMAAAVLLVAIPAVVLYPGAGHLTDGLRPDVTTWELVAFAMMAVAGATMKGLSGFGDALLVTPAAALIVDPTVAVIVLVIPSLMLNLFQVGETGTGTTYLRRNWALLATGILGAVLGVFLLSTSPNKALLSTLVAIVLLAHITYQYTRRFAPTPKAGHPVWLAIVGCLQGFLLGAVNLGPVLPAYLHTFERDVNRYIGGLSLFFALITGERLIQMTAQGLFNDYRIWLGSVIALVTLLGLTLGTILRRACTINKQPLDTLITVLLLTTAISLLAKGVRLMNGVSGVSVSRSQRPANGH